MTSRISKWDRPQKDLQIVKKPKKAFLPAEQPAEQLPSKTKTKPERKAKLKSKK